MAGQIYPERTMFLRAEAGVVTSEATGIEYEAAIFLGNSAPIVRSKKTGKWFTLTWSNIVELAIAAGIDEKE